jgi:hypothetical protein
MSENEPVDPWRPIEPRVGAGWGPPQTTPYGAPAGQPPPYGAVPYGRTPYPPPYGHHYGSVYPLPHEQGGTNGFAVASLIFGAVWLFWLGSILAVVFGVIGLRQIDRQGDGGRGLAIAGIVLGCVGLALLVLGVLVAAFGSDSSSSGGVTSALAAALR